MKLFSTVLLVLIMVLGLLEPSFASAYSNKAPIVGNDGLLVMSPEEYLGIDECDSISRYDDYYYYTYHGRGLYASGYDNGLKDP